MLLPGFKPKRGVYSRAHVPHPSPRLSPLYPSPPRRSTCPNDIVCPKTSTSSTTSSTTTTTNNNQPQWIGCPIVGDKEYGDLEANQRVARRAASRVDARRPLLHSVSLEFTHPFTNTPMSFKAPMPADMWEAAQNILRVSGTREQQEAFGQLQELRQSQADEAAPVGGRGAPRLVVGGRGGRKKKLGNRSKGAKAAFEAVAKAQIFEQ